MRKSGFTSLWVIIVVVSLALNGYFVFKQTTGSNPTGHSSTGGSSTEAEIYVCPMHPQVVNDHPADCPICGMKLVKRQSGASSDAALDSLIGTVNLSPNQELLANIRVDHPRVIHFGSGVTVTGTIREIDGSGWKSSAKAMGRIEKFFVSNSGEAVKEGDPIFDFYSPDIAAAAQEYLYVLSNPFDDTLGLRTEAVRGKLLSLGLEFEHLNEIARLNQAFDVYTFHAPRAGVVMSKMSSEGEWVMPGMTVIEFLDLSSVYVEGSLLEKDAARVRMGDELAVVSVSGETGNAKVVLIGPMADMMTRTIPFRAILSNSSHRWIPGSFVSVALDDGGGFEALSLPEEAVLITGRGAYVWQQTGVGKYTARAVMVGSRQDGRIAILDGVDESEAFAVTGAYLIDSDAQMRNIATGSELPMADAHIGGSSALLEKSRQASKPPKANNKTSYTCPMHPAVVSDQPGRCPDCGMYLVEAGSGK